MSQPTVCCVMVLAAAVSAALAQKSQGVQIDFGKVIAVEPAKNKVSVRVEPKNGEPFDKDYVVDEATRVVLVAGDERAELTGKDRLKNDKLRQGIIVRVYADATGKVALVEFTLSS